MNTENWNWRTILFSDHGILILLALVRILLQVFTNAQYGFFRDELVTLEDGRHLAWGYVAYPPVTPFLGRVAMELFGLSLNGVRFFSVLAQGLILLIVGLMVRAMGGKRWAQIIAALAASTSPASILNGTLLQYVTFDYLCWALVAYFVIRLLATEDPRWWLGIGAAVGFGGLTKIVLGFSSEFLNSVFESCDVAGYVANRFHIKNQETTDHPVIYVCRRLRISWPEFWKKFQYFG